MSDSDEYVKYVTERFVQYVGKPREERRRERREARAVREHWLVRWFGIAPMGVALWWRGRKRHRAGDGNGGVLSAWKKQAGR